MLKCSQSGVLCSIVSKSPSFYSHPRSGENLTLFYKCKNKFLPYLTGQLRLSGLICIRERNLAGKTTERKQMWDMNENQSSTSFWNLLILAFASPIPHILSIDLCEQPSATQQHVSVANHCLFSVNSSFFINLEVAFHSWKYSLKS